MRARLDELRTVVDDGTHAAVTDLARWRGELWLAYRRAERHMTWPPGEVVLLRSADGRAWSPAATFSTRWDDRDPKLLATDEHLTVYWGAMVEDLGADGRPVPGSRKGILSHAARTTDGAAFTAPVAIGPVNWWLWRPARIGAEVLGLAYGSANAGNVDVDLWRSDDGLAFERVTTVVGEEQGTEGALLQLADGRLLAVVRGQGELTWLCTARPPYVAWERRRVDHWLHAPALCEVGGAVLAAGRDRAGDDLPGEEPGTAELARYRTCLWRIVDGARTEKLLELPSGGDTSYCGIVADGSGGTDAVLLSYYSQHAGLRNEGYRLGERPAAVYLARVELVHD